MNPNYMDPLWERLNINTTNFSIQSVDNLLPSRVIINTSLNSWMHKLWKFICLLTIILPIQIFLCKLGKKTKYLLECLWYDPGRLLQGSPRIRVQLEDFHPVTEWEWGFILDMFGGITVKDSDGDTELPPNCVNSVPRHPPWFLHWYRHGDSLP